MNLLNLAYQQVWAMREHELEQLLGILSRESLDPDLARQIREDRAGRLALSARPAARLDGARGAQLRDGVALIDITGPIVRRADMFSDISGATSTQAIVHDLTVAMQSALVDAVLLVVDSPGGEVTGLAEAAQYIRASRTTKPIWAYIEGNGASAAYWLASSAGRVVAADTADVGWIGVVMPMRDPSKAKSDRIEFVSSQTPERPDILTEAGRTQIQASVDAVADVFLADVATGRGVPIDTVVNDFGQGGGLIGSAAVRAGLADATGTFESTLADLRQEVMTRRQPMRMAATQEDGMKFSEMVSSIFRGAKEAGIEIEPDAPPAVADTGTALPPIMTDPALAAELAALKTQLAAQQRAAVEAQAAIFADSAVRDRRALPNERGMLYEAYLLAAMDDQDFGAVTFSDGTQGARVANLEAMVGARPQHDLTLEQVITNPAGALQNGGAVQPSEERRQALLAMTPLGQAALDRRRER